MSEFTETYKLTEIHFKLLSPVIKHEYELTPSIISLLEKQLREKLEFQLDYYLKAGPDTERFIINFIQKPEVNWVTRAPTWPRIRNSLEQFRQLVLKEGTQNENILKFPREPLLKLIYIDEKTNNETIFHWTTTAALLVVQAILYSHREWTRPFHHDIWSAGQARKDLVAIGIPENFADKVAIMIAFQNLFRNGLKERPTEVGVWFGFDEFKSIKTKEETGVERRLKTKIEGLNDQWQRLNDIKNDLSRQRNYETRPEEKIRQQSLIDEKESELEKVENELTRHERELANIQNGNFDQLGDNIGFSQASAPVRNALAREIFKQWIGPDPVLWKENEKSTALSALGACTLCHDRRSTRQLLNPDDDFIDKYNAFLNLYDRIKHENFTVEKTILCGFEFTNYVFEGFEWNISFRQFATMVLNRLQGINLDKTSMILFSFGRFWSNREITNFRDKLPNYVGCFKVEDPRIQTLLQEVLLDSCGEIRFAHLVLEKDELFKLFFSEEEIELLMDDKENLSEGVWKWVGKAIEWIRLRRPWKYNGDDYLPFGAVDRVLRVLAKIHPTYFTTGRFTWRDPMPETGIMSRGSTITVPIKPPSEEELEECVSQENYFDPKLIVARYAAVAILNQRMAYGPGSLEFTFGPIPDEKNIDDWEWYKVINWIEEKNYHNTLKCYLDQVYSPFYANFVKLPDIAIAELPSNPLALCVDVGAGDVKVELWSVSCNDGKLQLEKALRQKTYKTSLGEGRRYQDAEKFAEILKNQIYPDDASDDKFLELANKSLIVIGIAWPGAVQGEPGAEYVAGTSRILNYFQNLSDQIVDNSPNTIHSLDIRGGFRNVFKEFNYYGEPVVVRLINDGEAHTEFSLREFSTTEKSSSCKIALTAGTGTALGVRVIRDKEYKSIPVLAEAGKLLLNLCSPFPDRGNFPTGVANKVLSKTTNPTIAYELLKGISPVKTTQMEQEWSPRQEIHFHPLELGAIFADLLNEQNQEKFLSQQWFDEHVSPTLERDGLAWIIEGKQSIWDDRKNLLNRKCYGIPKLKNILELSDGIPSILESFKQEQTLQLLAIVVAHRAGCMLADLATVCIDLFQADGLFCTGGPLSGATGRVIREFARQELRDFYGFNIRFEFTDPGKKNFHPIHKLEFPEPNPLTTKDNLQENYSGAAWGAGSAALKLYQYLLREKELLTLESKLCCLSSGDEIHVLRGSNEKECIVKIKQSPTQLKLYSYDEIYQYLETHRMRLGLHSIKGFSTTESSYVFVGYPDPILRH